jgi:hypothetical protein
LPHPLYNISWFASYSDPMPARSTGTVAVSSGCQLLHIFCLCLDRVVVHMHSLTRMIVSGYVIWLCGAPGRQLEPIGKARPPCLAQAGLHDVHMSFLSIVQCRCQGAAAQYHAVTGYSEQLSDMAGVCNCDRLRGHVAMNNECAACTATSWCHHVSKSSKLTICAGCDDQLARTQTQHNLGGQEAVGWDGQLEGNPTWPPSSIVLTICGGYAAGNEVTRQVRQQQQQQHYLPQLGWTAAAFPATPATWLYSELSWWGLTSSLPLHVAHVHCGSHYSVRSLYQSTSPQCLERRLLCVKAVNFLCAPAAAVSHQ